MRIVNIALFIALVMTSNSLLAQKDGGIKGANWRQITVLQSTRNDVEKLFGKSKYQGYSVAYDLKEGHLDVEYSGFNFCEHGKDAGWNVSEWTVIEVTFAPHPAPSFSSQKLDLTRFRKVRESPHFPDLISYVNDEEGVDYTVNPDGTLNNIRYFPSSQYNNLRCLGPSEKKR